MSSFHWNHQPSATESCYQMVNFRQTLKTKSRQFDNLVVTGGTVSCHSDNLRCHQWRRSCQSDDLLFSVNYSQWTPPGYPMTVGYQLSFVPSKSQLCPTFINSCAISWALSQYKDHLSWYGIPMLKIWRSQDRLVLYTPVFETSARCLRSIYLSLGMRQLFGNITMGWWHHN